MVVFQSSWWLSFVKMVVFLKNAVLWVSFVQMGSCGLLSLNTKKNEKNYSNSLGGGSPEKKNELCGWWG